MCAGDGVAQLCDSVGPPGQGALDLDQLVQGLRGLYVDAPAALSHRGGTELTERSRTLTSLIHLDELTLLGPAGSLRREAPGPRWGKRRSQRPTRAVRGDIATQRGAAAAGGLGHVQRDRVIGA